MFENAIFELMKNIGGNCSKAFAVGLLVVLPFCFMWDEKNKCHKNRLEIETFLKQQFFGAFEVAKQKYETQYSKKNNAIPPTFFVKDA